MPRKPRFFLPDVPVHTITRGNNRDKVFLDENDKKFYLSCLYDSSIRFDTSIYAYVLMDNHIHLLISSSIASNISKFMQHIGRQYVPYYNRKYSHTGTLWEGRFKASLVDDEQYLLSCYRYIELNPVRANMVKDPGQYNWSSYKVNALGVKSILLKPHDVYLRLGSDIQDRAIRYRKGFNDLLDNNDINIQNIRDAVQTGTPLGNDNFRKEIEAKLMVDVGHTRRGRPIKGTDPLKKD